jgi:adenosine deaminase
MVPDARDAERPMAELEAFIRGIPKAELHLHIEGSLEPEQMFAFARRNRVGLPFRSVEEVRAAYAFSNLQDFLDIYYQGANVLQTQEDFRDLALAYFARLQADGGVHAEIFFDPQTHTDRGLPFSIAVDGLLAGMRQAQERYAITSKLIMCFLRHLDEEAAFATLKAAEPWLDRIVGVGLDSSELGHPPSKFARVFAAARERGLMICAHAGEEGPPAYVREALDVLGVDRIDHGNRALEDADLTQRLVREGMTLTVCPLSNLKLCVVHDLRDHPLKRMLQLGMRATCNSDDPAYFGGYVADNYLRTAQATGLTRVDIAQLARNSFTGSFLDRESIARHVAAVDVFAARA